MIPKHTVQIIDQHGQITTTSTPLPLDEAVRLAEQWRSEGHRALISGARPEQSWDGVQKTSAEQSWWRP